MLTNSISWYSVKFRNTTEDSELTQQRNNLGGTLLENIISFLSYLTFTQWIIIIGSLIALRIIFKIGKSIARTLSTLAFFIFMATRIISYANDFKEVSAEVNKVLNSYPVTEAKELLEDKYGKLVSFSEENEKVTIKVLGKELKKEN